MATHVSSSSGLAASWPGAEPWLPEFVLLGKLPACRLVLVQVKVLDKGNSAFVLGSYWTVLVTGGSN